MYHEIIINNKNEDKAMRISIKTARLRLVSKGGLIAYLNRLELKGVFLPFI